MTYVHNSTGTEYQVIKEGPKVILMKCLKSGISTVKAGDIQKTSPAALKVLYSQKAD